VIDIILHFSECPSGDGGSPAEGLNLNGEGVDEGGTHFIRANASFNFFFSIFLGYNLY
jgi:hypothetical protein